MSSSANSVPQISVLIRAYNQAAYLRMAIESVLAQTFRDFELIIADDGSTDATPQVCADFARRDARVRVVRHERNLGITPNFQSGFFAARAPYFCTLDQDNVMLPEYLQKMLAVLQKNLECGFVFCDEWIIKPSGERDAFASQQHAARYARDIGPAGILADTPLAMCQQMAGINSTLFRTAVLKEIGGYRAYAETFADIDLFLNIADRGQRGFYVKERLIEYRVHDQSVTSRFTRKAQWMRGGVAVWTHFHFSGAAERWRRLRVERSYRALARSLLIEGDVAGARKSLWQAWKINPLRAAAIFYFAILLLPRPILQFLVTRRYPLEP